MKTKDFSGIKSSGTLPDPCDARLPGEVKEFLDTFAGSVSQLLEQLEEAALAYESQVDRRKEHGATARRILHNIKGDSGMMGLEDMSELCHQAESAVEELDDEKIPDMLLMAKDWLQAALGHLTGAPVNIPETNADQHRRRDGSKLNSLVVDDSLTCRTLLRAFLSEYGDCAAVTNSWEAVDAVDKAFDRGQRYDLICMDINMPEMDGYEALKAIRKTEYDRGIMGLDCTKIVMTSVRDDPGSVMAAFRAGCEAYIIKPVKKPRLLKEIRALGLIK